MPAVEYTKKFITSVVVGKDVVPRIGLHQMEALRADLISAIQGSQNPKVFIEKIYPRNHILKDLNFSGKPLCLLFDVAAIPSGTLTTNWKRRLGRLLGPK